MKKDSTFLHPGQCGDAAMLTAVGQFAVNLVGDDEKVMLHAEHGDLIEFLTVEDCAGRVGGETEEERLTALGDGGGDVGSGEGELVLGARGNSFGNAVAEIDAGMVGDVAGFVVERISSPGLMMERRAMSIASLTPTVTRISLSGL